MTHRKTPPYPAPYPKIFDGAIQHPDLLLWDSWIMHLNGIDHLYCLALARRDHDGAPIKPEQRNDYQFHFRHFESADRGTTWTDQGVALKPGNISDGNDAGNVWSGGVLPLEGGQVLFGFTGISDASPDHPFVQSINFAIGTPDGPVHFANKAASHPVRDRDAIRKMGYYLPSTQEIGHSDGEENGPITAWRDPYFYREDNGDIYAFWSAKLGPRRPAVAWGKITIEGTDVRLELLPPISLPDEDDYTQAEVPKICKNLASNTYFMMISACSRLDEEQPDEEVFKQLRLYKSKSLSGPWEPYKVGSNILNNMDNLFGASFLDMTTKENSFQIIAPYTERATPSLELTFAAVKTVKI
ncbi:hypothetical protein ACJ3XI_00685 [Litorimonas sp. RW-G-Af-16]|uniref:hypothetical protein n=1 Tax=Litorimonas sp. RW-G-Af-16 TaxID=3241168 RepID=UPI00390CD580